MPMPTKLLHTLHSLSPVHGRLSSLNIACSEFLSAFCQGPCPRAVSRMMTLQQWQLAWLKGGTRVIQIGVCHILFGGMHNGGGIFWIMEAFGNNVSLKLRFYSILPDCWTMDVL